jgi:hypothetical protein
MRVDPNRQAHANSTTPSEPRSDHLPRPRNEGQDESDQLGDQDSPDEEEPAADRPDSGQFEPL